MSDQLKMEIGKSGQPVDCLGMTFPSEDARREHFLSLLAEKLKDPAFRAQEGFPLGSDEDILALSDPPYYTACPNPFLEDFVRHHGKPYDPSVSYSKEPFTADVSEGKNDPIYNAHSYHTKVPHKAIMRYILHYTQPGDVVFDGFCGTGMTAVAAQLCGNRAVVESLGYRVQPDGKILIQELEDGKTNWKPFSALGSRRAVLNDLSPAATFIAYNYNTPVDVYTFEQVAKGILKETHTNCAWLYETSHSHGGATGRINYVVWSDVFTCSECAGEVVFWDTAVDKDAGQVREEFACPHCSAQLTKRGMERAWTTKFDVSLGKAIRTAKHSPVMINYSVGTQRYEKAPDERDLELIDQMAEKTLSATIPIDRMIEGTETRRNDPFGITHVHHFFTPRTLYVLGQVLEKAQEKLSRRDYEAFLFVVTGTLQIASKMSRFRYDSRNTKNTAGGTTSGTLYVPSLSKEGEVFGLLNRRLDSIIRGFSSRGPFRRLSMITCSSSNEISLPTNSCDYLFFDPPFGANINYSELNYLWESWLKVVTNNGQEAIENRAQGKTLNDYRRLMSACFKEAFRVLKPGRWMTVEFSNTQASVWNAIQTALQEAGFVVANVSALDKKQGSFKAVTTTTAVKQDLVISAYKPNGGLEDRFSQSVGSEDSVWDFVRTHLRYLPTVKVKAQVLDFIAERDPRIIFDRMVAWYVRHNAPVPLSSQEFQDGLRSRFPERDGMVFLPEQVAEYDRKRGQVTQAPQMEMFVSDERSAIDWLTDFLKKRPSTYQEVNPEFMTQLGAGWKKHETRPELSALLEDNFLRYDGSADVPSQIHTYLSSNFHDLRNLEKSDARLKAKAKDRWFVPDPNKAQDLEKKREKALLKEFEEYRNAPGRKLKEFRLEVLRAGFKAAWASKDYQTIVSIANKVPEDALQEDEKLLFWYDSALTRTGG